MSDLKHMSLENLFKKRSFCEKKINSSRTTNSKHNARMRLKWIDYYIAKKITGDQDTPRPSFAQPNTYNRKPKRQMRVRIPKSLRFKAGSAFSWPLPSFDQLYGGKECYYIIYNDKYNAADIRDNEG